MKTLLAILLLAASLAHAQDRRHNTCAAQWQRFDDNQRVYRGRLSNNPFGQDSTSNPFGRYGSRFSPDSINNPFGAGNPFSPDSPRNPFGAGIPIFQQGDF